ncbi:MAG: DUF5020 family protein [Bacteroidales bacterium]|nr:DUF5020 family protein [Bacteroidales bacterium]MBN2757293.1 DUF5020 family protein [Bacteroidales bacterium]
MFFNGKLTFKGFLDLWTQDYSMNGTADGKKFVLLTEPQLWLNINKRFSIGGEVEISNNFIFGTDAIDVYPTVALKWNM